MVNGFADSASNSQNLAECVGQFHHVKMPGNSEQCLQFAKLAPQPDLILIDLELSEIKKVAGLLLEDGRLEDIVARLEGVR